MENTIWKADTAHSEILFKVRHMMMTNVKGEFRNFDVNINSGNDGFNDAKVDVEIDTSSILTNSEERDKHLKSADFFDVDNHKTITFRSTSMQKTKEGEYKLNGDLTIKGVSKPIELAVEYGGIHKDPWGNDRAGFSISGELNRKDFGLNWNAALEAGGFLVGDTVKLNAEVQLLQQKSE